MLIIPHTADVNLARKPWVTLSVVALSLLIYIAQENNRNTVLSAADTYCKEIFSDPATAYEIAWNNANECVWELAELRSLPDPELFIKRPDNASKLFPSLESEEIDKYYETLNIHYPSFALIAPLSLDARLMYDPTVPNPWRMITSALAHASWWHVIGNLIFFIAFAPILELIAGRIRFVAILLLITVADSLAYTVAVSLGGTPFPTLGLSGVVYGMIGLGAYMVPRMRIRTLVWFFIYVRNHSIPVWIFAASYVGMDFWLLLTKDDYGGTNLVAHVSGAIAGYLAGRILLKEQREDYREMIDDEVEQQRENRSDLLGMNGSSNRGDYRRMTEQRQMREAEEGYESRMEDVYSSVRSENDSTAIMLLLLDYDLWVENLEVYEEIYRRMQPWGKSRALLCIGRLLIHLYARKGKTARAQVIAEECLALDPKFALADKADLGNMFQNIYDTQGHLLADNLSKNSV